MYERPALSKGKQRREILKKVGTGMHVGRKHCSQGKKKKKQKTNERGMRTNQGRLRQGKMKTQQSKC